MPATIASPARIWNYSGSRHSLVLAFMASCENSPFCLIFTLLVLGNPSSSCPSRPRPLTEKPPLWFYSVISPMLLLDSLPGLSFAKIILYLFFFLTTFSGMLSTNWRNNTSNLVFRIDNCIRLSVVLELIPLSKTFGSKSLNLIVWVYTRTTM